MIGPSKIEQYEVHNCLEADILECLMEGFSASKPREVQIIANRSYDGVWSRLAEQLGR